jgi:hypothetical protein
MKIHYTEAEKRQHVQKAYELVANGGSFVEYVALSGISRASLIAWRKQFGSESKVKNPQKLVALGKVSKSQVPLQQIVVSYYGATIEVGKENLLEVLRCIKSINNLNE